MASGWSATKPENLPNLNEGICQYPTLPFNLKNREQLTFDRALIL